MPGVVTTYATIYV